LYHPSQKQEKNMPPKAKPVAVNPKNQHILDIFGELAILAGKHAEEPRWVKRKAYDDGVRVLAKVEEEITYDAILDFGPKGKRKMPGIGKAITEKCAEYLETGKIATLEKYKKTEEDNKAFIESYSPKSSPKSSPVGGSSPVSGSPAASGSGSSPTKTPGTANTGTANDNTPEKDSGEVKALSVFLTTEDSMFVNPDESMAESSGRETDQDRPKKVSTSMARATASMAKASTRATASMAKASTSRATTTGRATAGRATTGMAKASTRVTSSKASTRVTSSKASTRNTTKKTGEKDSKKSVKK